MFKAILLAVVLLCISDAANPGVKVAISNSGLNYAAKKAVDILATKVPSISFPNVEGKQVLRYEVTNIRITSFNKPTANVVLNANSGLSIQLRGGGVSMQGRWGVKLLFKWSRGDISASSSNIDLDLSVALKEVNGKPVVTAGSCSASLGGFSVKTTGGILGWLINIIISLFKGKIRDRAQDEICKALINVVNNNANDELATLNLIAKMNDDLSLDYRLTENPSFTSNYMSSGHKGQFLNDPQNSFQPSAIGFTTGRMLSTTISDETINSLGRVVHSRGLLDFSFNITDQLVKKLIKGANVGDFFLNLRVYSKSAPTVTLTQNKIVVRASVFLEFKKPTLVLKLAVDVTADGSVSMKGDNVRAQLSNLQFDVSVVQNSLGFVLNDAEVNELVNGVVPAVLPLINDKLDQGIPLPKVKNVNFSNFLLAVENREIRVACDVS